MESSGGGDKAARWEKDEDVTWKELQQVEDTRRRTKTATVGRFRQRDVGGDC